MADGATFYSIHLGAVSAETTRLDLYKQPIASILLEKLFTSIIYLPTYCALGIKNTVIFYSKIGLFTSSDRVKPSNRCLEFSIAEWSKSTNYVMK